MRDSNPEETEALTLTWELTDEEGRPLSEEEAGPCTPRRAGCFVPHKLGLVYRVHATVTDPQGATTTAYRDFTVQNRSPNASLEVLGRRNENGHYPLMNEIRFSAAASTDPDNEDRCSLSVAFATVSRPLASVTGVFVEGNCTLPDIVSPCGAELPAYCITPDAPGTYRVRVTVTDQAGESDVAEQVIEVDEDAPPCLTQLVPRPVETVFVSRSDGVQQFSVNVSDDLDPWPPRATNAAGYPTFRWSLKTAFDPEFVVVPDLVSHTYSLDLTPFSPGEEVLLRVEVQDRVDRTSERPCEPASPVCPQGADPLAPAACVQRVTWHLEVY